MISRSDIEKAAEMHKIPAALIKAVVDVESSGNGFSSTTGKIIIQFEPTWFKRKYSDWKKFSSGYTWASNKVENQTKEWLAFNSAFKISPNAAMQSTSIGLMQVMGFHYRLLGFKTVGDMWDYAKESEFNQLDLGIRFIKKNDKIFSALLSKDWQTFSYYYNGSAYKKYRYDTRLAVAYNNARKTYSPA